MTATTKTSHSPAADHEAAREPAAEDNRPDRTPARHEETGSTPSLSQLVADNPTLAIAGCAALGAIVALAVMNRREAPNSVTRRLRRDLAGYSSELRRTVRDELRESGLQSRLDSVGNTIASIDWKPYIKPLVDQAVALADEAKSRLATVAK